MLSSNHTNHIRFCLSTVLFLLFFVFTSPTIFRAEEKTPPLPSEENRDESQSPSQPKIDVPVKEFSDLFPRSRPASSDKKTPSQYAKGERKASQAGSKPDTKTPALPSAPSVEGNFQTQEYVVKEGDWLAKILREKGVMNEANLPELLSLLRKLNSSLRDLDMIQPGEKIIILVKVVPGSELEEETRRKLKYETYTVQPGDILSQVVRARYGLSRVRFNREYLRLFAECNPSIADPNTLLPGQVINLPHYPPADVEATETLPVLRDLEKSPHKVALKAPTLPEPSRGLPSPPPPKWEQPPRPKPSPPQPESSLFPNKQPALTKPSQELPSPTPPLERAEAPQSAPPPPSPPEPAPSQSESYPQPETSPFPNKRPALAKLDRHRPQPAADDRASPSRNGNPPSQEPAPPLAPVRGHLRVERDRETTIIVTDGLGTVISSMGEEWIHSGEHFIPMTSGGHINLDAESYPIIRLKTGITVIVDVHSSLPEKMARILESSWANYRVVRLSSSDDLRYAMDKVLSSFHYPKIARGGAPLTLSGDIPLSITGDWIITTPEPRSDKGPTYIVINLLNEKGQCLPPTIKNYLKRIGVEVIEYPSTEEKPSSARAAPSTVQTATDSAALITTVLKLMGQPFTAQANIPAYSSQNKGCQFTVQADFYVEIAERRYVIDLEGLTPDAVSLLKDGGISVLSLTQNSQPADMVSNVLEFLNVQFHRGPHAFMAKKGDASRNVKLTLEGISFYDQNGKPVLATSVTLPPELVEFLSQSGYRMLLLTPFAGSNAGHA